MATDDGSCCIIEVMGRDAGYIALHSGIATGAENILIPERKTDIEELVSSLMEKERSHFNFALADIRKLPYPDNFFDKLVCLGVIEHMDNQEEPLKELLRVLKPNGVAIIMTPNLLSFGFLDRVLKQALGKWHMGFQIEFSPKKLSKLLINSGFKDVKRKSILRKSLKHDCWSRKPLPCNLSSHHATVHDMHEIRGELRHCSS